MRLEVAGAQIFQYSKKSYKPIKLVVELEKNVRDFNENQAFSYLLCGNAHINYLNIGYQQSRNIHTAIYPNNPR